MKNHPVKILFATHSVHKFNEIRMMLPESFILLNLKDTAFKDELAEEGSTLEENSAQKARLVYSRTKMNCFADDTGLEAEALNNRPGVHSARYAGDQKDAEANIIKLLNEMKGTQNRAARFRSVICLVMEGKEYYFEGVVNGKIAEAPKGKSGFGYDPVFIPEGFSKTFAEMSAEEKNAVSHRSKALNKLVEFLTGTFY